ncbi:hypothetical protein E1176_12105 [Fulvivirga sp. RKSG066]|uniref:biliverdin-producing heme oxygenase n=1 Tax=Fulvivirga aurantia TaxID=2529383 RepID=UPI0012BC2EFE|nr:biliverdin-producing heme oxygenase [Fulvivirga aurantia]MTI21765.1 hypothetical protein [Fulvivirga aurantia]
MIDDLRRQTKHLHDRVEVAMQASKISDQSLREEDYKKLIITNFIVFESLKSALKKEGDLVYWFVDRTDDLHADLEQLGIDSTSFSDSSLFAEWSYHKKLGAIYVLNGSALGGSMIARYLKEYDWIESSHFYRNDADIMNSWKKFKAHLESREASSAEKDEVITGAQETFEYFEKLASQYTLQH